MMLFNLVLSILYVASTSSQEVFETVYITSVCNGEVKDKTAGRLEASSKLTYNNDMDCKTILTAASDKKILLQFQRFELEDPFNEECVDYLNIYDGKTTSSGKLNAETLCGYHLLTNYTSSGSSVMFHLKTDESAVFRGFGVVFTAVSTGACDELLEFKCANNFCVDTLLQCDDVNQCGDNSDEDDCTEEKKQDLLEPDIPIGLIVGLCVAFVVIVVVVAIVVYKVREHYKWKKFLLQANPGLYGAMEYPVTEQYSKYNYNQRLGWRHTSEQQTNKL